MTKAPERFWPESLYQHRDECHFKFAPLDTCNCVEKNMTDHALALVATALHKAVHAVDTAYANGEMGNPGHHIHPLIHGDAQAALERHDAKIRNEALREAAQLVQTMNDRRQVVWAKDIRTLITKED